ncbi:MAG: endolytic transglycosylase MltG [Patescibacteria group bacterium]
MCKKIFVIITVVFVACVLSLGTCFYWAVNRKGSGESRDFIVRSGQSTNQIAQNLQDQGLVKSALIFSVYAKLKAELIQVGVYSLSPSKSMKEILGILASGETSEDLVTIPEGWRVTQIDEYLAEKQMIEKGALTQIASADEGYLFPDTYRFLPDTNAEEIRKNLMDNFNKKTVELKVSRDNLILASIIEREAKFDEDRPKIAGVYLNRLEKNMKLEADPTIQYAKGSWNKITLSDYRNVDSPYNTYLNFGLPPGPICNPGLKSIEAVLHPEKNGYIFFFHKSDGHAVFSTTLQEHEERLKQSD